MEYQSVGDFIAQTMNDCVLTILPYFIFFLRSSFGRSGGGGRFYDLVIDGYAVTNLTTIDRMKRL
jgi:hypothetical protein